MNISVKKNGVPKQNTDFLLYFLVHGSGIIFPDIVSHFQDFHRNGTAAHIQLQPVTDLDFVAGLYYPAIDADATIVAGFVGYGAALDQAGDFQKFVQTHLTWQ